jgi:polyisoprenoid-binding protein YceI
MPLSIVKQSLFGLAVALALASCNTLKNTAARFAPSGNQTYDASALPSGTYQLDLRHASLVFSFNHMGFSETRVWLRTFDATLEFDDQNPGAARLSVTLDPASVETNDAKFNAILTGKDYLDVEKFPEAGFVSDHVYFLDDKTAEVPGTLTLHGVSREAVLRVTFNGGAKDWLEGGFRLGFSATGAVNRSEYGLKNLLALTGDEVTLTINAEFHKKDAS